MWNLWRVSKIYTCTVSFSESASLVFRKYPILFCFGASVVCFFSFSQNWMVSLVLSEACKQKYSSAAVRVVGDYLQKISLKWYVKRDKDTEFFNVLMFKRGRMIKDRVKIRWEKIEKVLKKLVFEASFPHQTVSWTFLEHDWMMINLYVCLRISNSSL